jgi:L-rhamnose mutarotase
VARAAFVMRIRSDKVEQYVEAHRGVWPDLREAISASGIRNYSIYLYGNLAFGYLEADDLDRAWVYLAEQDANQRWQDAMAEYLEQRVQDEGPTMLPEIFRLD